MLLPRAVAHALVCERGLEGVAYEDGWHVVGVVEDAGGRQQAPEGSGQTAVVGDREEVEVVEVVADVLEVGRYTFCRFAAAVPLFFQAGGTPANQRGALAEDERQSTPQGSGAIRARPETAAHDRLPGAGALRIETGLRTETVLEPISPEVARDDNIARSGAR